VQAAINIFTRTNKEDRNSSRNFVGWSTGLRNQRSEDPCWPHHLQSNGKLERFHKTLMARVNLLVYLSPEELQRSIGESIEFYDHRRYIEES
jgi:hypothetical protein